MLKWTWLSVIVVILDQLTKNIALNVLEPYQPVAVMPVFNWTLMFNTGAAFSFLHDAGGWQRWFFALVAVIVSIVIIAWMKRLQDNEKGQAIALAMILGGAVGNVIDRLYLGHVIDFIDVYYKNAHWPAFNLADSAISLGVAIIVIDSLRQMRAEKKQD